MAAPLSAIRPVAIGINGLPILLPKTAWACVTMAQVGISAESPQKNFATDPLKADFLVASRG